MWASWLRLVVFAVLGGLLLAGLPVGALPAFAAEPRFELEGRWVNPPATLAKGDVITGEWRLNLNDDAAAPANEPVKNVDFTVTLQNGLFKTLPDLCLTRGVTPVSSISADGRTLVCNLGTRVEGTAVLVQTPVVVDGITGSRLTSTGTYEDQTKPLPPIPIRNRFGMDILWGTPTNHRHLAGPNNTLDFDFEWTLFLLDRSDAGPNSVSYDITLTTSPNRSLPVGDSAPGSGACTPFNQSESAEGHPYSAGNHPNALAPFVQKCTLVRTGTNRFRLTLTGIDYSQRLVPTRDSAGNPLPTDRSAIASGSVWFRIPNHTGTLSVSLVSSAPLYRSVAGTTYRDAAGNNRSSKTVFSPGSWAQEWNRTYTRSGGTRLDNTYKVSAGTEVAARGIDNFGYFGRPNNTPLGECTVIDTRYAVFDRTENKYRDITRPYADSPFVDIPRNRYSIQYYTGGSPLLNPNSPQYNPNTFDCGITTGWVARPPANKAAIKAVRINFTEGNVRNKQVNHWVYQDLKNPIRTGQDVWTWHSYRNGGAWINPGRTNVPPAQTTEDVTPVPGGRYRYTTGGRDVLHIVYAIPAIRKTANPQVVQPGAPVTMTLTYSANGSGAIPKTVDNYRIVDTLPVGLTYVAGSATPAPRITTDAQGRQVLTWVLNDVPTNVQHRLTYKAVAGSSVRPGQVLTNSATSSVGGEASAPARAQVTISTNGYTTLLKKPDVEYIPNVNNDGIGSGSWTVTLRSFDPLPQAFTDTIDILPYNGDGRGTKFSGSYTLDNVTVPAGATVYYTSNDPATLSDDPRNPANGRPGNPAGNTAGWTTTKPATVTAVRVIGGRLAPGAEFPFKVSITTNGAKPQDVYVNRSQGVGQHTGLVMRTSAKLVVSDYVVKKTSNPPSGSTVRPGDTITYTVTVTQRGPVPAAGVWTDSLAKVLDDATYNNDAKADIGTVSYADGKLSWQGVVPVGKVATITYSVKVKDVAGLRADGDTDLTNVVTSPGCKVPADCTTVVLVGYFEYSKTSVAKPGSTVKAGEKVTYTVQITHRGKGAVPGASIKDNLSKVLDDATWNNDLQASAGEAKLDGTTLTWTGDLAVGDVVTLTYSVTVKKAGEGDDELSNVVTTDDDRGSCVPAPDQNPDCKTVHPLGYFEYSKTSVAKPGSTVKVGERVTYTVQITHRGKAPLPGATISDDLSKVLDDATWNNDLQASAGEAALNGTKLTWTGDLAVGDVVTVTYSVTVKKAGEGDDELANVVTTDDERGTCVPAPDQNPDCKTGHKKGYYEYSKTSVAKPGSTVKVGEKITYTVQISHRGKAPVAGATISDDLSAVLDDASWNDDLKASAGEAKLDGTKLTWTGDLAVGDVVTVTYSVTVTKAGEGDDELSNVVTTDDPRGSCIPAPDQNPDCKTGHKVGDYEVLKTSDPESGSAVEPGDTITYTVTVRHVGIAPVEKATFKDNLSKVLDDATWNGDLEASGGEATYAEPTVSWNGPLAVDEEVTVTYSVTVTAKGDRHLKNVVTTDGTCVPAEGQDEACTTEHFNGSYTYSKTSVAKPGSAVKDGEKITYTVRIEHVGKAPVEGATISDDLSAVLDDATWNDDLKASAGEAALDGTTLTWTGDLDVGDVVTLTYSVTANAVGEGDDKLRNVVTADDDRGVCVPAPDQNPDCKTSHQQGGYEVIKTSDPESGSEVKAGDKVTYTVTVRHVGAAPIEKATLTDDLSAVLDDATWNDDLKASAGKAAYQQPTLAWSGPLGVGAEVTITYSVTVTAKGDKQLKNVVTTPGDCVPADGQDEACTTKHKATPKDPSPLPDTGAGSWMWLVGSGLLLLLLAAAVILAAYRRRITTAGTERTS